VYIPRILFLYVLYLHIVLYLHTNENVTYNEDFIMC